MVPYDGSKSHIATYNFCYICKERLDTYYDDQDESWYFVDTRQVRFSSTASSAAAASKAAAAAAAAGSQAGKDAAAGGQPQ